MLRTICFSLVLLLAGCTAIPKSEQSPLSTIEGQEIKSIEVCDCVVGPGFPCPTVEDKVVCTIVSAREIQFIMSQFQGLKARRWDHSHPEFDIVLNTKSGQSLRLRVCSYAIGPDVPASGMHTYWFPVFPPPPEAGAEEFKLYTFLKRRAFGPQGQPE